MKVQELQGHRVELISFFIGASFPEHNRSAMLLSQLCTAADLLIQFYSEPLGASVPLSHDPTFS